jgi:hypothetical protein
MRRSQRFSKGHEAFFALSPDASLNAGETPRCQECDNGAAKRTLDTLEYPLSTEAGKGLLAIRAEIMLESVNPKLLLCPYFKGTGRRDCFKARDHAG